MNSAAEYRTQNKPHTQAHNTGRNTPFGVIERRISTRYLRAKKSQGGVGLIAAISFICIALAIAAMIFIMSIMNGFRDEVIRLTIGSEGHIYATISDPEVGPAELKAIEERMLALPGVNESFQYTQHFTGVQTNGVFGLGQVIGITAEKLNAFGLISDAIDPVSNPDSGSLEWFGQGEGSEHQIAIGSELAKNLGLRVGDKISIYSPRTRSTVTGPQPIRKNYTVGAIFKVGLYQTDLTYIYMELEQATLLMEGGRATKDIQLRLETPDDVDKLIPQVKEAMQTYGSIGTWRDRNAATATALRTEQIAMRFIFMVVVIIAAFPVLASMIMLVKNKSKDIAILRTIGATQGGILRIFLMSGAMIGILGTLVGLVVGISLCVNIGLIQAAIEGITGKSLFPPEIYQLAGGIPVKIVWVEVFSVAFWGFLISALATLIPALSASKIDPVDALRYE